MEIMEYTYAWIDSKEYDIWNKMITALCLQHSSAKVQCSTSK